MAIDFPNSPSLNDIHTEGGYSWQWNGTVWNSLPASTGASVTIADTPPSSPEAGNLWWDSSDGTMRIYYDDGDTEQWVDVVPSLVGPTGPEGPAGEDGFETGSKIIAAQSTAPTGWTKDTTHNNKALRLINGTVGTGGSSPFTTTFASRTPTGSTSSDSLSTAQLASHTHAIPARNAAPSIPAMASGTSAGTAVPFASASEGSGSTHSHTLSAAAMDFAVEYVDVVIITKD